MRTLVLSGLLAIGLGGCGVGSEVSANPPEPAPVEVAIDSAIIKRAPSGRLITALRGSAAPGATITVGNRSTMASPSGTWAIRTNYDRDRDLITVFASAAGASEGSADIAQPRRPRLRLASSTGVTTTSDLTTLKGRVRISRGSIPTTSIAMATESAVSRQRRPSSDEPGTAASRPRDSPPDAPGRGR